MVRSWHVPLVDQSGTPNFPFKTRRVPPVPLVPPLSLRRMRKNEVGGAHALLIGKREVGDPSGTGGTGLI